jgi:outer membrane protein assembly factor BamB
VRAVAAGNGKLYWKAATNGPIYAAPTIEDGRLFVGSADGWVYAFEAATGRSLWKFLAAPAERWIPVYGKLISTWPVAGGVAVQDGVVYAAAGIAHYDGTHVYALDAATGDVKWYNGTSGRTSEAVNHGVSLQGDLTIRDGELRFVGGGVHEEARYDLATGQCLNEPFDLPRSRYHTAFHAYYPDYGKYVSLDHTRPDGTSLCYDCTYEGSMHSKLMLLPAANANSQRPAKPVSRWGALLRRGQNIETEWQLGVQPRFNSFIVGKDLLVAAGHTGSEGSESSFLAAIEIERGTQVWRQTLPGPVVRAGTAVNDQGQILVALENGKLLAFSAER